MDELFKKIERQYGTIEDFEWQCEDLIKEFRTKNPLGADCDYIRIQLLLDVFRAVKEQTKEKED